MTEETTIADPRSPERVAAAQTYARAKELRLQADTAVHAGTKVLPRQAFDAGTLRSQDEHWEFRHLQRLGVPEALSWAEPLVDVYCSSKEYRPLFRRGIRAVLGWINGFPGETWDERWFASGLDEAPRTGTVELSAGPGPGQHGPPRSYRSPRDPPSNRWYRPGRSNPAAAVF